MSLELRRATIIDQRSKQVLWSEFYWTDQPRPVPEAIGGTNHILRDECIARGEHAAEIVAEGPA